MPLVVKDRVKETTTTTSTGSYTLAGAAVGYQSFSVIGDGNTTYYCVTNGTDWEVGIGTYTASGTTLSRDTILESSNSGSAVNWGSGSKDVFVTYPAERSVYTDGSSIVPASSAALPVANGGTGQTSYTDGQLLIGNSTGNTLAKATLTAGSNVTITNGPGSITIAATAGGSSTLTISNKTGAYTVVSGDNGTIINCTAGTFTVSLTAAASLGSGFNCWIWNTSTTTTDVITIDPNGAETIDGQTTLLLSRGEGCQIVCDGTNWQTGDKKTMRMYAENMLNINPRPVASGNAAFAIGRGATASGAASISIGDGTSATSQNSVAIGQNSANAASQAVSNTSAMALGGSYASGTDSFAAAIANNTSSYGARAAGAIALGDRAQATAARALCIGQLGTASGADSIVLGGGSSIASGTRAVSIGFSGRAQQQFAVAIGAYSDANIIGKFAYAGFNFAATGDSQKGLFVLRGETVNATPKILTTDNSSAGPVNQVVLPNNSAYAFTGIIIARQQTAGGSNFAAWEVKGAILRDGSAGTTTLGSFNINRLSATAGASAWTIGLSADTTNGGLAVTGTGALSTNIRWVATIQTAEVTYA